MLTTSERAKMLNALKSNKKNFLDRNLTELNESGTRLMINSFLSDVPDDQTIEEIKTEYMIRGTYADYVIQTNGVRHFQVKVKALSLQLSEKLLQQTTNYGADEGIDWALLSNGKSMDFDKLLFNKPNESIKDFSADLSDGATTKSAVKQLQHRCRDAVAK
jgi:hypothetical protein